MANSANHDAALAAFATLDFGERVRVLHGVTDGLPAFFADMVASEAEPPPSEMVADVSAKCEAVKSACAALRAAVPMD